MVHRVVWRVEGADTLAFWEERLAHEGVATSREADTLVFTDHEGLATSLPSCHRRTTR